MSKVRVYFAALVTALVMSGVGVRWVAAQNTAVPDVPTVEVATEVPTVEVVTATPLPETPTAEPTAEPTPISEPTPDPGISNNVLFLVVITIVTLAAAVLMQTKNAHDLAIQAGTLLPEWAWIAVKSGGMTGLDTLQSKAKQTIDTGDDEEVAKLRKIAVDTIAEIDAKRGAVAQSTIR